MRHLIIRVRARLDVIRGEATRRRAGTHLLEEMGDHPEQIRDLPDPAQQMEFAAMAEDLLDDDELAEIVERTGWIR